MLDGTRDVAHDYTYYFFTYLIFYIHRTAMKINTKPFLVYHILLWGYSNTCRFTRAPSLPPIVLLQESPPFPTNQRRPLIHSDLSWTMLLSTFLPTSIPRPPSTSSAQPAWGCYPQRTRRGSLLSCIGPSRIPTPSTFPRMVSMWFQANLKVGVPWSSNSLVIATISHIPRLSPVSRWLLPPLVTFPGSPFQSRGRNSIFGVFVNTICRRCSTPLIIFEWIEFSQRTSCRRTSSGRHHKMGRNREVMGK